MVKELILFGYIFAVLNQDTKTPLVQSSNYVVSLKLNQTLKDCGCIYYDIALQYSIF